MTSRLLRYWRSRPAPDSRVSSLRRTLLLYILSGLFPVLALSGIGVALVARHGLRAQFDRALTLRARTFASLVKEDLPDPEDPGEESGLALDYSGTLGERDIGVLLRITADDGEVIARSPTWPTGPDAPHAVATLDGGPVFWDTGADFWSEQPGPRARGVAIVAIARKETDERATPPAVPGPPHTAIVEVIGRTDSVEAAQTAVNTALIVGGALAMAATAAYVWIGIRWGLTPLGRLSSQLRRTDAREPEPPSPSSEYPEELRPIVDALTDLLARVRAAMDRERRFTDAAAHELRTPIAELRTITDIAERWPDQDRLRRAVTESRAIADEMVSLLEYLLASARGGAAYAGQAAAPVALLPLARALADARAGQLRDRGVSCEFRGDEAAAWTGPRGAILVILRNLIDNASEYTPERGSIRVSARAEGPRSTLEIENGPVSLAPADLPRMFEPLWRAEPSRADRAHRGLGLSIVAAACEALHLHHDAAITPDQHLRIRISG